MREAARSLWAEPRVPDAPRRVWRDWVLVAALAPIAVLEALLREDLVWPVVSVALALVLLPTLLWRRTHPLQSVAAAFGLVAIVQAVSLIVGDEWEGLGAMVFVILLVYALFRWGSGRDAVLGLAIVSIPVVLDASDAMMHPDVTPPGEVAQGALFVLLVAAVGASVRYSDNARRRGMDQVKLLEREQLARELHDTVAHHVSAIAIRAQAGRVVASTDPAAAMEALAVIEQEASRTLAEMRTMVGALRQGEEPDLAPQRGIAQVEDLATSAGEGPRVDVELSGDLDGLPPSVGAAVFRLAQESITNAVRHARHATRVEVVVRGESDCVRMTVHDDGDPGPFDPRTATGFGLVGMAERAKLLGGTLEAGPTRNKGWAVTAVLPRGTRS
ncbi:sensor histidine kinase [Actinospongicola halichondriae]|uniref:sensor histidine kinase n=1 Tax=Actinospongicola halichondriae TaxID=3236844 RepID=UPI003D424BAB